MATVEQRLEPLLTRMVGATVASAVRKTLPATVRSEAGTLDVIEVRELTAHLETCRRTFAPSVPESTREFREAITGGSPARARVERFHIRSDADVLVVQRRCQELTRGTFGSTDCVRLATAASELARNIYVYAKEGDLTLTILEDGGTHRFEILAEDQGPGIANLEAILAGHYVSRTGLGRGLAGTKVLLDEFSIETAPGAGTRIRGARRSRRA